MSKTRAPGLLIGLLLSTPAPAGDPPAACRLGDEPGQDATLACYQDLDRDGDGSLSPDETEALPRTRGRFEALDADGDGALSPAEFQGGLATPPQKAGAKGA
jgi:hypothetical protein